MTRTTILALLVAAPAAAHAQLGALQQARGAPATSDAGNARIEGAVDRATGAAPAAAPPAVAAPSQEAAPPPEAAPSEPAAAPAPGAVATEGAADATGAVAPPDTYTIRPGDTLWDLSGRFLNNPWYWPKIWSYNPEITNPHWIYPGNVLRFFPSADEGPARVEPVDVAQAQQAEEPEEVAAPEELEDFSRADMKAPPPVDDDTVAVAGPYKIGYVAPKQLLARHDTFVTKRELAESGKLKAASEDIAMLSTTDRAYATFANPTEVKQGETYVVYRTVREIRAPGTKELIGYQSSIIGAARVVAIDAKAATLEITECYEPIERGALLGPWTQKVLRPVKPRPNERSLEGKIVASQADTVNEIGEYHVVFVDRGKADGVENGNTFEVVRAGDPYGRNPDAPLYDPRFPKEDVGQLLVIDARDHVSSALVTRSLQELAIGDRVEMRPAGGAGAGGN